MPVPLSHQKVPEAVAAALGSRSGAGVGVTAVMAERLQARGVAGPSGLACRWRLGDEIAPRCPPSQLPNSP